MNTIYVTAWPEKGMQTCSWSETKVDALTKRISPSFKIVEFTPKLTQEDIEKGVTLFRVNLHKEGHISFERVSCDVVNGVVENIEGVVEEGEWALPYLYIVADAEADACYGKWLLRVGD